MIVIGCGTGRCGTVSLQKLLNNCKNTIVKHEVKPVMPWERNVGILLGRLSFLNILSKQAEYSGEVAFYYLNYLRDILNFDFGEEMRVICIKRNREDTVESYIRKTRGINHWVAGEPKTPMWDAAYPTYSSDLSKRAAIGKYYEEYYDKIHRLNISYPRIVKVFKMNTLNSKDGQDRIFDFVGMSEKDRRYTENCKFNETK